MSNLPEPICPGTLFNYTNFITGQKKAASFLVKIYDPN